MVGQHIGKYRVTQQIGRGGMGTVYAAIDETLHRDVAIKVLNAGLNDPTVARRFRAEAVTVARLNHPGIATIYELVQHDGQWLMVMEFVRGDTLEQAVAEKGPLPVARAAELTMQVLSALAHAHSLGVVHRDLKPANLMLTAGGGMKIMDFGIARVAGAEQLTSAGFMMGTPAYMAPEQVLGQDIDARTDLYAMGLVLYHVVSGAVPFKGTTPIQVAQARIHEEPLSLANERPDLPRWLADVVDIALQRDPMKRFRTALDFREAVRRGLANLPIERPDSTTLPPELMATAAPGSLRVEPTPATGTGRQRTEAPVMETAMAADVRVPGAPVGRDGLPSVEVAAAASESGAVATGEREAPAPSSTRTIVLWVAAVLLLAGIGGGWYLMRGPAEVPPAAAESALTVAATPAPAAEPSGDAFRRGACGDGAVCCSAGCSGPGDVVAGWGRIADRCGACAGHRAVTRGFPGRCTRFGGDASRLRVPAAPRLGPRRVAVRAPQQPAEARRRRCRILACAPSS